MDLKQRRSSSKQALFSGETISSAQIGVRCATMHKYLKELLNFLCFCVDKKCMKSLRYFYRVIKHKIQPAVNTGIHIYIIKTMQMTNTHTHTQQVHVKAKQWFDDKHWMVYKIVNRSLFTQCSNSTSFIVFVCVTKLAKHTQLFPKKTLKNTGALLATFLNI